MLLRAMLALTLASGGAALAQEPPASTIESPGEATVYGLPSQIEYWFERTIAGGDAAANMGTLSGFGKAVTDALAAAELQPGETDALAPAIVESPGQPPEFRAVVRAAFPIAALGPEEGAAVRLGEMYGKLSALCEGLQAQLRGPAFLPGDPDALMRSAVAEAVANAYPPAEAASGTLGAPIFAVDRVEIVETLWNAPSKTWRNEPSLRQVSCTAKVKVTYALAPAAPSAF